MTEQSGAVSGGDRPAATTASDQSKERPTVQPAEVAAATGQPSNAGTAEDSGQGGGNEAPTVPAKKIQFTGKVRRGLALFRMVQLAAMDDSCPPIPTFIGRWTNAQKSDYNAALAWAEQEENWEAVEDAWERGLGRKK